MNKSFRLVSACWGGVYPFDKMGIFHHDITSSDPADLKQGDVLVVWGGGDIHPSYYNKGRSLMSGAGEHPTKRDTIEWSMMQRAKELNIPIIGVCRGGQMACALAGGYLIQHVNNHAGRGHEVITDDGRKFFTNTIHHQMMMPGDARHVVFAKMPERLSNVYYDVNDKVEVEEEYEYLYFPEIKAHAIQWHPEGMGVKTEANMFVKEKLLETLYD